MIDNVRMLNDPSNRVIYFHDLWREEKDKAARYQTYAYMVSAYCVVLTCGLLLLLWRMS